jgi:hypothetical protein
MMHGHSNIKFSWYFDIRFCFYELQLNKECKEYCQLAALLLFYKVVVSYRNYLQIRRLPVFVLCPSEFEHSFWQSHSLEI